MRNKKSKDKSIDLNLNPMRRNHYELMRNIYGKKVSKKVKPKIHLEHEYMSSHDVKKIKGIIKDRL